LLVDETRLRDRLENLRRTVDETLPFRQLRLLPLLRSFPSVLSKRRSRLRHPDILPNRSTQSPPLYRQSPPHRPNALHSTTTAAQHHSKHTFQTTTRNHRTQFCKQNAPPQTTPSHHTSCIINDRRLPAAYTGVM